MIVRLTWRQLQAVRQWMTPLHRERHVLERQVGKLHEVALPFVGWRTLSRIMQEQAYTKWGRGRPSAMKGEKAGTASAIRAIERACVEYETHPAMRNEGVMGFCPDHLTVWKSRIEGIVWQPTPVPGEPMKILVPVYDDSPIVSARKVTWKPPAGITFWNATDPGKVVVTPPGLFKDQQDHLGWA